MELAASAAMSYQDLLDAQRDLFKNQIEKLQQVVATQCKLTGVNPLSQEMAAGALSIKIGKRPRDLLNPKAVKYMQSVFSIKDAISKRETREISAQFGVTLTQVRDFFVGQRARVRKFVRVSKEKDDRSFVRDAMNGEASTSDPSLPVEPVPLNTVAPSNIHEGPSCVKSHELLSGMEESDPHFVENIFSLMRKEESYSGQVKLLQWILRIENPSVLHWFLNEGGLMILASWLGEAANEEQTSFLHVILKLLDYLPLRKALPGHMSAILQSVNRLRFYRTSDISHRARTLLSKWSNMFGKNLSKKSNGQKSASDLQDEMLLKQSINEVMGSDSWDLKSENSEEVLRLLSDNPDNLRKLDAAQPLKMLTAPGDDTNKRRGVLQSHTRERRKVQLVEQPGQRLPSRGPQVAKSSSTIQSRPLSADDIQKAKMRAQFMQSKHGKMPADPDEKIKPENPNLCAASNATPPTSVSKNRDRAELEERRIVENDGIKRSDPPATSTLNLEEPPWKRCKRIQIPWMIPPEIKIRETWSVRNGEESKEFEVQKNRQRREREIIYRAVHEIPSDPREPWDREMDYDDTLTPVIPIEQLPDDELAETTDSPMQSKETAAPVGSTSSDSVTEPDLELLAELLKNPELVFALTSGQAGNLSSDATVKLLDMIKAKGVNSLPNSGNTNSLGGNSNSKVEVSLPSPTPTTGSVLNGPKPDFTRNPFSRQLTVANGNTYQGPAVVYPQGMVPSSTVLQSQIPASTIMASQPSSSVQQLGHGGAPPPLGASLQTSIQLAENWKAPVPTNPQLYHQTTLSNSFNTQYMTTEKILNANLVANSNRALSTALPSSSLPTVWPESLGNVQAPPASMESIPHSTLSAGQVFESKYGYPNNRTVNNYNAYPGRPVENSMLPGTRGGREIFTDRPGFESWSPDNSPSRRHEHSSGQSHRELDVNSRHRYATMPQNPVHPSRYQDHNVGPPGHKHWRDYTR
ncbi:homeobox protein LUMINIDEPENDENS [Andrographis paniculata]|uniref:homeobox protein LUMINIDEPENDENS n=1 Tax=Andrographis paniculata TaxID=175694 RepID=UPI0021E79F56|nr:homeobox protein LUMINIDEPENDENS [Andrographis paniculata]